MTAAFDPRSGGSGAATRRRRLVVAGLWTASTVGALAFVLALFGFEDQSDVALALVLVVLGADVMVYASVGAVLAIRRPGNLVASVLIAAGALIAATFCGFVFGASLTLTRGPDDPMAGAASIVGGLALYPALVLAGPALALVFPDGRLPGPRWRWAIGVIAGAMTVGILLTAVRPGLVDDGLANNPIGLAGDAWSGLGALGLSLAGFALAASLVLGIAAVVVRYRRGAAFERAQLRWFLAANLATALFLILSLADGSGSPTAFDILGVLSLSLPPLAVGIAVMRYRLYEIDRIISRTIAYGLVTAILVAVYSTVILVLQGPLGSILGGDTVSVALSTLVVAALFQPVRRRVQRAVDRRFDRARFDGERTAAAFAERLRDQVDLSELEADIAGTIGAALRPTSTSVWLRLASRDATHQTTP